MLTALYSHIRGLNPHDLGRGRATRHESVVEARNCNDVQILKMTFAKAEKPNLVRELPVHSEVARRLTEIEVVSAVEH